MRLAFSSRICPRLALMGSVTSCPGLLRKTDAPGRGTVECPTAWLSPE